MHADLVQPPGAGQGADQGKGVAHGHALHQGESRVPPLPPHGLPHTDAPVLAPDGPGDLPGLERDPADDDGEVFLAHLPPRELLLQAAGAVGVPGQDQHAAGLTVQAVAQVQRGPRQLRGQDRGDGIAHDLVGGLVDHDQVRVLMQHRDAGAEGRRVLPARVEQDDGVPLLDASGSPREDGPTHAPNALPDRAQGRAAAAAREQHPLLDDHALDGGPGIAVQTPRQEQVEAQARASRDVGGRAGDLDPIVQRSASHQDRCSSAPRVADSIAAGPERRDRGSAHSRKGVPVFS